MAEEYLRPVGGFIVKQRGPGPNPMSRWKEPRWHRTLDVAFDEAERVARQTGRSYSILQEVGSVEPQLRVVEPELEALAASTPADDATAVLRVLEWSAEIHTEEGGAEPGCPACGEPKRLGHAPRCRVARSLGQGPA